MKKYNKIYLGVLALLLSVGISSCESYLDRDPATAIDPEDAYKNFFNFQGFVDELYGCIPNIMSFDVSHWNLGEEEHYSLRQTGDIYHSLIKEISMQHSVNGYIVPMPMRTLTHERRRRYGSLDGMEYVRPIWVLPT